MSVHQKKVAMNLRLRVFALMGIVGVMATTALANRTHLSDQFESNQRLITGEVVADRDDGLHHWAGRRAGYHRWKNADLSKTVQVRPDGRISLPLIGDVAAVSRTSAQLTEEISTRLKSYMENPTVSIVVKEVNSYAIFVLGEVVKPGRYPLKSKTTLLQAVTLASGFTPVASRNKIVIFRFAKDGDPLMKIKASYDDIVLRDGINQNIELKPGDTIVVPSESMVVIPSR